MKTRKLGNTDLNLTEIGFGAWAIGGGNWEFGWGPQDDDEAIAAIRRGLELGINWIDTAAIYGLGHSEELVAKAVGKKRKEVVIATKCSLVWDDKGQISDSLNLESVMAECEQSLKRLQTDCIDLYQIHWPDDEKHIEDGWDAISKLIEQGKVRYGGVSNFNVSHMRRAGALHPVSSLQPPYSMIRRAIEKYELPYCKENGIGVVAYSPMYCGLLTGKFDITKVADNDWRKRSKEFSDPNLSINLELVEGLRKIAENYHKTVAQLSLAWVLRSDVVTSAIVGARRPTQIEETVLGSGWSISEDDLKNIDNLLVTRIEQLKAGKGYLIE